MREKSGQVNDARPLVNFLYLLMRDKLTCGGVEDLMLKIEDCDNEEIQYTNGWLAQYAQDVAWRLTK